MTTLHMEVETCHGTQQSLSNTYQQMSQQLQTITNSVQGLQGGAWQGNSATEFFNTYDQLRSQINGQLDQLNTLATRLQNEITEWETAASKLG